MWDVEDLVARGEEMRGCPYFASRDELVGANLVLCPYNYLVDPAIRASMDINLKDSVRLPAGTVCRHSSLMWPPGLT